MPSDQYNQPVYQEEVPPLQEEEPEEIQIGEVIREDEPIKEVEEETIEESIKEVEKDEVKEDEV